MDYKKFKDTIYLRIDRGEEVVEMIKKVCDMEHMEAGSFQGIGACDKVVLSTWIQEKEDFINHTITGMLEMVSLLGNVSTDKNGGPFIHSHAVFSYLKDNEEIAIVAGHLKEAYVSYTGEIVLTSAEGKISRMLDSKEGIDVWKLS